MTIEHAHRFFVITGGPGSGKTTLVEALGRAGFSCSVEAGRGIIQDQVAIGGRALPWADAAAFAELMLSWEMRSYRTACQQPGLVFFDRGVPDVAGYLRLVGFPVPAHADAAAKAFRYHSNVFIVPPWHEIFAQDAERKQSFGEAQRTYATMVDAYTDYGYDLVTLPLASVEGRVRFILDHLREST